MSEKEYLTKEKFEELQQELEHLQTTKRREVAEQLQSAKGLGDLSENAEYHEAREEQSKVEARILQLEEIIKNAEIVNHKKSDIAEIGSEITVQKVGEKEKQIYTLVGSEESDFSKNKISNQSPLGVAMIGKSKGDEFVVETPKGKAKYKIVELK